MQGLAHHPVNTDNTCEPTALPSWTMGGKACIQHLEQLKAHICDCTFQQTSEGAYHFIRYNNCNFIFDKILMCQYIWIYTLKKKINSKNTI